MKLEITVSKEGRITAMAKGWSSIPDTKESLAEQLPNKEIAARRGPLDPESESERKSRMVREHFQTVHTVLGHALNVFDVFSHTSEAEEAVIGVIKAMQATARDGMGFH